MGEFYRIDEIENAVDYLEKAGAFYASEDPNRWKWLVISLHGALYGFAICAVQGTDPSRVTEVTKRGERLINLDQALKRCQSEAYMRQYVDSQVLACTDDEKQAVRWLSKELRNNFEHFRPMQWSIMVLGMPKVLKHISRVIRFLALECGNILFLTQVQRRRIEESLAILER